MPAAHLTVEINAPLHIVMATITDFAAYPSFLPDMAAAEITRQGDGIWEVRFSLRLIRQLVYTLKPTDIVGAVATVVSRTAEMTSGLIDVLKKSEGDPRSEEAKQVAGMIKTASDLTGKINGLAKSLK